VREAINFIWKLGLLAEVAAAVRILQQGLAREYPALFTACCILPIKSALLMNAYGGLLTRDQARSLTSQLQPIEWLISAWVVFELLSRWTGKYPGARRHGRLLAATFAGLAVLISLACGSAEWQALSFAHNFRIYYMLDRVVWGTLALFAAGIWLFFRNYPLQIAPNLMRHTNIAAVYFSAIALSTLTFTLNGLRVVAFVNLSIVTVNVGCFGAWALSMTREGQVPIDSQ